MSSRIQLRAENIRLQAKASDKTDAIRQAGNLLVSTGNIHAGYIESMLAREQVAHTYLGNGIAIPHGLPKDRELILKTGISILQIPAGVTWNPGEIVTLVVGIAAKSDEHLEVLSNLTHVLDDPDSVRSLSSTRNPAEIVQRLTGAVPTSQEAPPEPDFVKYRDLLITGSAGFHARPATMFVSVAKEFQSEIRVRYRNRIANGKSLGSLLQLGVHSKQEIRVMARGADEDAALHALAAAVESGLGEEEEPSPAAGPAADWVLPLKTRPIPGIVASPGLVMAPAFQFRQSKMIVESTAKDPEAEKIRLTQALESAKVELSELYEEIKQRSGEARAAIFLAHREFLEDPDTQEQTMHWISEGHSAGWAWQNAFEPKAAELEKVPDPLLAARATDLRDVGRRVLRLLSGKLEETPELPKHPFILLAEDLTPSDTARLDPALTLGFCTSAGGPTSHSAIIARSLDIPAIVGAGPSVLAVEDGTSCILDGNSGNLYPNPEEADVAAAREAQAHLQQAREEEKLACYQPAIMLDGYRVEVVANIGSAAEALQAVNAGAEGVGLMRTEFLFLNRDNAPDEEEQFEVYSAAIRSLNGLPLIIRTLDIGGDKEVPYLNLPKEENPFLGIRGIRLCFSRPDLFETQLRSIYRASKIGPVKIMFPMISTLEDLMQAKESAGRVRAEVNADPVGIGIMVEVPSAVVMANELAPEVDFFSVGTNDLTQYTLGMDRGHPVLARQADALHPAVLRMIDRTVQAARGAGKWVGVCGGMAGDPKGAAILAGLGVTELSVSIPSVAAIKARIRQLSFRQAEDLAKRALACRNAKEVRALKVHG